MIIDQESANEQQAKRIEANYQLNKLNYIQFSKDSRVF